MSSSRGRRVGAQLVVDGWEVYEDDPKTDTGARTIALDSDTVQALMRHRAQQDKRGRPVRSGSTARQRRFTQPVPT
ncbi:hypothetical protein [Streptomyces mirabilis]